MVASSCALTGEREACYGQPRSAIPELLRDGEPVLGHGRGRHDRASGTIAEWPNRVVLDALFAHRPIGGPPEGGAATAERGNSVSQARRITRPLRQCEACGSKR
jgi:hypothetical protein